MAKIKSPMADNKVSIAAILIALCSLFLALYEGYESRLYKRLSVRPELQTVFYYSEKGAGWHLFNSGLGPARIRWFEVTVDNKPKKNWREVVNSLGGSPLRYKFSVLSPNYLLKLDTAGSDLFWTEDETLAKTIKLNNERVNIKICYCSLYDECWQKDTHLAPRVDSSCKEQPSYIFGPDPL